ncbi:MAG: hypothetical protein K0S19_1944, partial [Geminicoccaceae bacterium]|nr:hypothetical protein [Geminicoccaceae bacterium]
EWRAFDRKWDRHFSFRGFGGVRRAGRQLRSRARQQLLTLHHPLRRLAEMDRWSAELGLDQKRVRSAEDQVAVLTSFDADHIKDPTSFYSEAARSAVAFQQAEEEGTWGAVRAQLRQAFERSRIEALHAATPGEQAVLLRDAPRSQELEVVEIVERWQREKSHRALDLMLSGRRPSQIEPAEWERLFFNYCVSEEGSPMGAVWSFAAHSWGPESARGETAAEGFLNYVREAGLGEPMAAWQKVMRHAPASRAFDIMCPGSDPDHVVTAPSDPYGLKSEFPGIDGLGSFEQRFRRRLDY